MLSEEELQRHSPVSPMVIGKKLSDDIQRYVREQKLGYYPALDFFKENEAIDASLLDAVSNLSWLAGQLVRNEIRIKLRPVFSSVKVEAIRSTAYAMPKIRPRDNNLGIKLAAHYAPDTVKVDLRLGVMQKHEAVGDMSQYASHLVMRWLTPSLRSLVIDSSRLVQ